MFLRPQLGFVLALLVAGAMWFYVQHVMIPHQLSDAALHDTPRGNLSDLYPRWLGARELLLHHRDPYGDLITRQIQVGYYGRALNPGDPRDPTDQQGFAYPVYVVFLLAPTIWLPFAAVQTGFRWLLIALTATSAFAQLRVFRRPSSAWVVASSVVLFLGSFQAIQGFKLQQLSLLVAALIAFSALLIEKDQLFAAGILLALATIKPQLALPIVAWFLFWAVSDWRKRNILVWGFTGTMFALIAGGEVILPGWIGKFHEAVIAYRQYNNGALSDLELLFTPLWGRVLTVAILLLLAMVCWRYRQVDKGSTTFHWITALFLAATILIAPKQSPYNQVLLLSPILLIGSYWPIVWANGTALRVVLAFAVLIVAWPWMTALGITIAALFTPTAELQRTWEIPLLSLPLIPLIVFVSVVFVGMKLRNRPAVIRHRDEIF